MAIKTFDECLNIVESFIPRTLKSNTEYKVLIKTLAYSLMKNYESMDRIDNAYNVDFVDDRDLPKLADTLGISYPVGASAEVLRLLLKYYGKIIKSRGTLKSIKQMIRVLEFSEADLYNLSLDDYSSVEVKEIYDKFLAIKFDGITDFDYAYTMLRKVVPAGYRYEVMNLNGPIVKDFELFYATDKVSNVNILCSDSATATDTASYEEV